MNTADFGPGKVKNDLNFARTSNSGLKLQTFQFSNVRELETIKYVFATPGVFSDAFNPVNA